jgi:radical SAM superfamily enzyme YgiQ (UPF0313 family)
MSALMAQLWRKKYDVVAFGCIVTGYKWAKQAVEMIKKESPHSKIIVGNSVASSIPIKDYLPVDKIVRGEGDKAIVTVLKNLDTPTSIHHIPMLDINEIPFINWDLFNMDKYIEYNKYNVHEPYPMPFEELRVMPINSARGCLHRCTFCYQEFHDYPYRYRSVKSISEELRELRMKYEVNYITFYDDLTIFSKKRAQEFIDIMDGQGTYWTACCRGDLFTRQDKKLLKRLKESGCVSLGYSLESANKDILKAMNKKLSLEQFAEQKRALDKAEIATVTSIVVGYPQETKETLDETFSFCLANSIYPSTGYLQPLPGTPIYNYALKKGYIKNEEEYWLKMGDRQDLRLNMTSMPRETLENTVEGHLKRIRDHLKLDIKDEDLIKTKVIRGR